MSPSLNEMLDICARATAALEPKAPPPAAAVPTMIDPALVRAAYAAPRKPSPTAPKPSVPFARVITERETLDRLPAAVRAKTLAAINENLLATLERRVSAEGLTTGPSGEPVRQWLAGQLVERIARIQAHEHRTGKRLAVLPAFRAAQLAHHHARSLLRRNPPTAAAEDIDTQPAAPTTADLIRRAQAAVATAPRRPAADDVGAAAREAIAMAREAGALRDEDDEVAA